jgi:branched-chain amino acid transport system ATP-binding protein
VSITFRGRTFRHMNSRQVAEMGVARTFQNLALFKGMSVLDNIMTGRNLRMTTNLLLQALRIGTGTARRDRAPRGRRAHHRLPRDPGPPQDAGRAPALRPAEARRPRAARSAMEPQVLLLDEPMAGMNVEEKQDMCRFILDVNDEFGTTIVLIEHDMGVGDGHLRPRRRARLRPQDRRRHAARGARQIPKSSRPTWARPLTRDTAWASSSRPCSAA